MTDDGQLTPDEFRRVQDDALAQGYGNGPDDYDTYEGQEVVLDGRGVAPGWMAEVFARMAKQRDEDGTHPAP